MMTREHSPAMRLVVAVLTLSLFAPTVSVSAQNAPRPPLTNDGVIQMVEANLSESLILSQIADSQTRFDFSTPELIRLSTSGVSDTIIEAMRTLREPLLVSPAADTRPPQPVIALVNTALSQVQVSGPEQIEYLLLASIRTSTMQNELNEAADAGYRFLDVMGGDTAVGGSEVVSVMERTSSSVPRFQYRLLATGRTSTMQNELQEAGDAGFEYRGQTVFNTAFGADETIVILERDDLADLIEFEYRLLATSKTETMQEELREAGEVGFEFVGLTVGSTLFGGDEVISILRRPVPTQ